MTADTPTTTAIERHQGNTAALTDEHYLNRIPSLAANLARSNMCPDNFRGKPDEIAIVGYALADNGIRLSISTLPQCYVVHNRPGYMAQLQSAMAALHRVRIRPVGHLCDESSATVEVLLPDGSRHEVTFTMGEAVKAGLVKKNQMYGSWPANMLVARATTRAIGWYCPEVKLGLAGTADMVEIEALDGDRPPPAPDAYETGEAIPVRQAKWRLMEILLERVVAPGDDADERKSQAKAMASLLWSSHRLPNEEHAVVALSAFDALIDTLPAPAGAASDEEPAEGEVLAPRTPPEAEPEPDESYADVEPGVGEGDDDPYADEPRFE